MTATALSARPFDLERARYAARPFPMLEQEDFLQPEVYRSLCESFPSCPPSSGPTGTSLYWGDPAYEELVTRHPGWRALFQSVQCQEFVDDCLARFRESIESEECLLDLSRARYVAFREPREDKELRHLRQVVHEPHELWVRMDIHQGHVGYSRAVHVDHRRRVLTLLLYFCDADELGMQGGELVLHPPRRRWFPGRPRSFRPRHNRMVGFACSNASRHSVPEIVATTGPRDFVQVQISSSVDCWR